MKFLISFCNQQGRLNNLAVLDSLDFSLNYLEIPFNNIGFLGITQDERYIYTIYVAVPNGIAIFNKADLSLVKTIELPELNSPHSILIDKNDFYIVNTGSDQVFKYCKSGEGAEISLKFENVFWTAPETQGVADTNHINSLCLHKGDFLVSGLGFKEEERWTTAKNGFIFNISTDEKILEGVRNPHSLFSDGKVWYFAESFYNNIFKENKKIITREKGYLRGLAISKDLIVCGNSIGRLKSKSTQEVNVGENKIESPECNLLVYKKGFFGNYSLVKDFVLSPDLTEIYDVVEIK